MLKLYKDFVVQGNVKKARLYATALGVYEAEINGEPVDDTYFHPGWTNYRKRLQYQTCAVTLHSGKNHLALTLANGWWRSALISRCSVISRLSRRATCGIRSRSTWWRSYSSPSCAAF